MRSLQDESGFTLLELLVVLSLLGFLAVLTTSVTRLATEGWNHLLRSNRSSETLSSIDEVVRSRLSSVYPAIIKSAEGRTTVWFHGSAKQIDFVGSPPERFGAKDAIISKAQINSDGTLHLTWRFDRSSENQTFNYDDVLDGLNDASFAFFGKDGTNAPHWSSTWSQQPELPGLIALRFLWLGKKTEIVIAPTITGFPCLTLQYTDDCGIDDREISH